MRLLREARKRWSERAANGNGTESEKGPNEVVRMWEEMGALGRGEGSMVGVCLAVIRKISKLNPVDTHRHTRCGNYIHMCTMAQSLDR